MKNNNAKKLNLNRKTIAALNTVEMQAIQGGTKVTGICEVLGRYGDNDLLSDTYGIPTFN